MSLVQCSAECSTAQYCKECRTGKYTVQYIALQHCVVFYSTVKSCEVCNTMKYTLHYSAPQFTTVQHSALQCSTVQHSAPQCTTALCSFAQYSVVQYSVITLGWMGSWFTSGVQELGQCRCTLRYMEAGSMYTALLDSTLRMEVCTLHTI